MFFASEAGAWLSALSISVYLNVCLIQQQASVWGLLGPSESGAEEGSCCCCAGGWGFVGAHTVAALDRPAGLGSIMWHCRVVLLSHVAFVFLTQPAAAVWAGCPTSMFPCLGVGEGLCSPWPPNAAKESDFGPKSHKKESSLRSLF